MQIDEQSFSPEDESLSTRLKKVQYRMQRAAEKSGRNASDIVLVAVTKTIKPAVVNQLLALGIKNIGENKVQEAQEKRAQLQQAVTHHLIGHLQTNKARKALELFDLIQTLDSPRLAGVMNKFAHEQNRKVRCLIEVKMGEEVTKTGIAFSEAENFVRTISSYENLQLDGLMAIAPLGLNQQELRDCFRSVKKVFDQLTPYFSKEPILSLGMSDDFETAIEEGSTMVRVGRALFGDRS